MNIGKRYREYAEAEFNQLMKDHSGSDCFNGRRFAEVYAGGSEWTPLELLHFQRCDRCQRFRLQWEDVSTRLEAGGRLLAATAETATFGNTGSYVTEPRDSLVLRLQHADPDAESQFLQIYLPALQRFGRRYGLSAKAADDFADEVATRFLTVWREGNPSPTSPMRDQLFKVAEEVAASHFKEAESRSDWAGDCERQEYQWAADQVRATCDELTWRAFQLSAIEGRSNEEIVKQLNKPLKWVILKVSLTRLKFNAALNQCSSAIMQKG